VIRSKEQHVCCKDPLQRSSNLLVLAPASVKKNRKKKKKKKRTKNGNVLEKRQKKCNVVAAGQFWSNASYVPPNSARGTTIKFGEPIPVIGYHSLNDTFGLPILDLGNQFLVFDPILVCRVTIWSKQELAEKN
jgi:hypothetical protein